ncbi:hypothetical protein HPP92_016458 [Vanilla planifolia]|uniref:F-box/kelch-repeat protein n=1 Tax=Vanilla planifolia TaxID=51239 RepID=A0A835QJC5_VANPL|nr:hypothetical protein HPP92_016458 [Vanilla planifolia]
MHYPPPFEKTGSKRSLDVLPGQHIIENDLGRPNKSLKLSNYSTSESDSCDLPDFIDAIGKDISIDCLIRCSRSDYGSLACVNRGFRSLIQSGKLYRLRRENEIREHWVYFSCNLNEWESYDPYRARWINLPRMPHNECFMCSDKESLAVGTELLVFGKEVTAHIVLSYSILTNSWSPGVRMNSPRCLFGSASHGEKAIVAGGSDAHGVVLSSAELYNSETQTWTTLPSMNTPRKMCSGVFMDKKFYVIGGMTQNADLLTCGEEFDLEKGTWRVIPNMSLGFEWCHWSSSTRCCC